MIEGDMADLMRQDEGELVFALQVFDPGMTKPDSTVGLGHCQRTIGGENLDFDIQIVR